MQEFSRDKDEVGRSPSLGEQAQSLREDVRAAATEMGDNVTSGLQEQVTKIGDKAKGVAADAGRKIGTALDQQRASGANYLGNVANLVHQAADVFEREAPQASNYIHQAAEQIDNVAEAVRTKNAREVVHDVEDFARRQPAIFFGGALLLGFAAVRVLKSSAPPSNSHNEIRGA